MAADAEPANLVLEHLRHIRRAVDSIASDTADLKIRVGTIEHHLAAQQVELAGINRRIDRQDERLNRIERRLDLVDA